MCCLHVTMGILCWCWSVWTITIDCWVNELAILEINELTEMANHSKHMNKRLRWLNCTWKLIGRYLFLSICLLKNCIDMSVLFRLIATVNDIFNEVFLVQILQAALTFANCAYVIFMVGSVSILCTKWICVFSFTHSSCKSYCLFHFI